MIESVTIQRRFPRVFLTGVMRDLLPLEKSQVIWPSQFPSQIFDFGRTAVSIYQPLRLNLNFIKGDIVRLGFKLGDKADIIQADCRVIRGETRLLTVELLRVGPSQLKKIQAFFTPEVIARHIQVVPKENISPEQTFNYWLHGPQDTNIYVWKTPDGLSRFSVELGDHVVVWDGHGLLTGPSRDTLSYATEDYAYYTNFLAPLTPVDRKAKEVRAVVGLLEKIEIMPKLILEMIESIEKSKKS